MRPLFREFMHLPLWERAFVAIFVSGLFVHGSVKRDGGVHGSVGTAPRSVRIFQPLDLTILGDDPFPVYTNALDGVKLTGLLPLDDRVRLRVSWPADMEVGGNRIDVFHRSDLTSGGWSCVGCAAVRSWDGWVGVDVPRNLLPDEGGDAAFFMAETAQDSDGDGLSDAFERLVSHTNPGEVDTDHDGRPDGEEVLGADIRGLGLVMTDPLDPDSDDDGLSDGLECRNGFDPRDPSDGALVDSDGDGLANREELGWIEEGASLPTFDLTGATNLLGEVSRNIWTARFDIRLPFPVCLSGVVCTNAVASLHGVVGFVPSGRSLPGFFCGTVPEDLAGPVSGVSRRHPLVAAYWTGLYAPAGSAAAVRTATKTAAGDRWFVVEYSGMKIAEDDGAVDSDAPGFQLAVRESDPSTVHVRYQGNPAGGGGISIGARGPLGRPRLPYAFNVSNAVTNGLVVSYHLGTGTDPRLADTDDDGLTDAEELRSVLPTDPLDPDMDHDGIPDGWELAHGMDPRDAADALADADGDGLDGWHEYLNDTNPSGRDDDGDGVPDGYDSDGDGVADGTEVSNGSDPNDSGDGGIPPPAGSLRGLEFNISGDYAAWVMDIEGLGPEDRRVQRVQMSGPDRVGETVSRRLRKGNSYKISLHWLNCAGHEDDEEAPWYCWQAQIDELPYGSSFVSYDPDRLYGNEIVFGNGWIAENSDGLLTGHVHMHAPDEDGEGGGNVARGLSATLHVLDIAVTAVRFNHDPLSCTNDALSLRHGFRDGIDAPSGEWREDSVNEPVCYVGGVSPTVEARFRLRPALPGLVGSFYAWRLGSLGNLEPGEIEFEGGETGWVPFRMLSSVPAGVQSFNHFWDWRIGGLRWRGLRGYNDSSCTTTGPHRVYTVLAPPLAPWVPNGASVHNPWVEALSFINGRVDFPQGEQGPSDMLAALTRYLFYDHGLEYDVKHGHAYYSTRKLGFDLTGYIVKAEGTRVNCFDQGTSLFLLGRLLGIEVERKVMRPFGYIQETSLVGRGQCNNPFYANAIHVSQKICPRNHWRRSGFSCHCFVTLNGRVYDSCAGPSMGTDNVGTYIQNCIDHETTLSSYATGSVSNVVEYVTLGGIQ